SKAHQAALKKCKKIRGVSKKRIRKIRKANRLKVKLLSRGGAKAKTVKKVRKAGQKKLRKIARRNKAKAKQRKNCIRNANERFRDKPVEPPVKPPVKPPVDPPVKPPVEAEWQSKCATAPSASLTACGSVGDAYVTDAEPEAELELYDSAGQQVATGEADESGAKIFYDVEPGPGYTVRTSGEGEAAISTGEFPVLAPDDNPDQPFYDQIELKPGLNYVTMRDGVELAMTVRLPVGKTLADGPFPTFIEHSGYDVAAPHDLIGSLLTDVSDPLAPGTSTAIGALIGPQAGFAAVSVQMRGSGCSGGAYDLFGLPTTYDGYDMVETVAAQDWVRGKVGMGGISYSGISQLFAAGTQPPHLAAISPMSVTDDIYQGTGFPGGIFNNGFAYSWISARASDAQPAPGGGQNWAKIMSTTGDPAVAEPLRSEQKQHCLDNQELRLQTRDFNDEIESNPFRTPALFDHRAPGAWMERIDVPVFLLGQFQDEQTGAHFPEALHALQGKEDVWITLQNGVHVDALGPSTVTQWMEFMKLFVAEEVPRMPPLLVALSATLYDELAKAPALPIEESSLAGMPNVAAALTEYRKNPRVRILMDNGAAIEGAPGALGAAWEEHFTDWPIPSLTPTTYYLGPAGELSSSPTVAGESTESTYKSDSGARPARTLGANAEGDSWLAQPPYDWEPVAEDHGLGWTSDALTEDVFIAGPSSLDLYLKSNQADTDLQVTLTEVRPDGEETYVQNGWLRASHRAIDPELSTANNPIQTHLEQDAAPLVEDEFNLTRVQIFPVSHVFRADSKIRVTVQAPGGDRTIWNFDSMETGDTDNTIGFGGATISKLVLPVIPGVDAQDTQLPTPTALRGQPSREYEPASNGG
ncbi:MAG: CocE/NonD family hydrolase, partial [Actinomycetota bacterium]|nr:CocE/NonD family hydrolase [Actinomycetota bacterium]